MMAPESAHGRRGNLTSEEAVKLKLMWTTLLDLFRIEHRQYENQASHPSVVLEATTKNKKKWTLLGSKPQPPIPGNEVSRWSKDYRQALASYTPKQLHHGFWRMQTVDHPDDLLLRFLRARKWDVEAALMMFVPAITFINHEINVPDDLLSRGDSDPATSTDAKTQQEFIKQLSAGKAFVHGLDKDGRPVLYVRARLHHQIEQSDLAMTKFIVYMIEMIRIMMPPRADTAVSTWPPRSRPTKLIWDRLLCSTSLERA